MAYYSKQQLLQRDNIIQSQLLFGKFLNRDIVNALINLFDDGINSYVSPNHKITKYIEDERENRMLNSSNVIVRSEVYGYNININKPVLFLMINKNGKDFIHLTIHLVPKNLHPKKDGMMHIFKNIYKKPVNTLVHGNKKNKFYALIEVSSSPLKPHSLQFSIGYGNTTPNANNVALYDAEIQQEMDVIITVLNRLFDETNKKFYIGNKYSNNTNIENPLYPIHNKTNKTLKFINTNTNKYTRCNKGIIMDPSNSNLPIIGENTNKRNVKNRKSSKKQITRKVPRRYTNNTVINHLNVLNNVLELPSNQRRSIKEASIRPL